MEIAHDHCGIGETPPLGGRLLEIGEREGDYKPNLTAWTENSRIELLINPLRDEFKVCGVSWVIILDGRSQLSVKARVAPECHDAPYCLVIIEGEPVLSCLTSVVAGYAQLI